MTAIVSDGSIPVTRILIFQANAIIVNFMARTRGNLDFSKQFCKNPKSLPYGAGDGIWTHDLLLGKETFYRWTTPARLKV